MVFFDSICNFFSRLDLNVFYFEEFVTILFVYNFFKLLLMSSLMELIWPTQFFNRKNTILFKFIRKRAFLEFLIYLFKPFIPNKIINRFFVKYLFVKRFSFGKFAVKRVLWKRSRTVTWYRDPLSPLDIPNEAELERVKKMRLGKKIFELK